MESNKKQKNMNNTVKQIQQQIDDGCEVHKYIMPDGSCNCENREAAIIVLAAKLISLCSR